MTKKLFIIFSLGLFLRLILSVMGHYGDIDNYHIIWAKSVVDSGLPGFYRRNFIYGIANYPPLSILMFTGLYKLYFLIDAVLWKINTTISIFPSQLVVLWRIQSVMMPAMMKLPAILADLGLAYLLYRWTKKPLAAALVLFNPAFFYNSSYWGQIDVVPIFFVMWAFYRLYHPELDSGSRTDWIPGQAKNDNYSYLQSSILFTIALLIKQTVIVFLPLYLLLTWKKSGWRKMLFSFIPAIIIMYIIFLPFYRSGNLLLFAPVTFWDKITAGFGSVYLTAHAFNFWGLITGFGHIPDGPWRYISLSFVGFTSATVLYLVYKRGFKKTDIVWAGFLIPWTVFLFATRMHERHLMLTLPFLLIAAIQPHFAKSSRGKQFNNTSMVAIFVFISLFHFLNLYSGWWSPPIPILITIFSPDIIIKFLITITIGLYFYLYYRYVCATIFNQ